MSIEASEELSRMPIPGGGHAPGERADRAIAGGPGPSRNFLRQAVIDTVASRSARVGLYWLGVIAAFAIFAPFIANSHPMALKMDGHWSSPLLRYLTPADVILPSTFLVCLILAIWRRFSFLTSLAAVCLFALLAGVPSYLLVRPPENVVYEQYRQWAKEGKIQQAWYVLIPFSPSDRLRDDEGARLKPPNRVHWLGTDTDGADLLSNIIHASRIAMSIGFLATGISVVVGVLVGGLMGYFVGAIDLFGMRFIEIFEAIPRLLLLITVTAFVEKRSIYLLMTIIGLTSWTSYARFIRGEFFTLRKLDFVQAAIAAGLPRRTIVFRHMLINGLTPVLVSTTFGVAGAILTESILSFLGLGLIDEPSWGGMLNHARAGGVGVLYWIAFFPGLAIFLTVFAYNLVGEAVRDALDPKLQKRD